MEAAAGGAGPRRRRRTKARGALPLITAERIRRATQFSESISTDLAAHEVSSETARMHEFFRAVERVYQRLVDLFRDRES